MAAAATGTVTFVVQAGAYIPSGTALQALDGVQYQTTADAVVVGTSATAPLIAALKEQMAELTEHDYIVAVGDPSLIAAAACIASRKTGGLLRMLKWDRMSSTYIPVEIQL